MLMPIRLISILFLCSLLMGKECKDETYIQYHSNDFNLTFVHNGFLSPQTHQCESEASTIMYNNFNRKNKTMIFQDNVIGIREFGANILAIYTVAGAHSKHLYFLYKRNKKHKMSKSYVIAPILIDDKRLFFVSDTILSAYETLNPEGQYSIIVEEISIRRKVCNEKGYALITKNGYSFKSLVSKSNNSTICDNNIFLPKIKNTIK